MPTKTHNPQANTQTRSDHNQLRWFAHVLAMGLSLALIAMSLMTINRYIEVKTSDRLNTTAESVPAEDNLHENAAPADQSPIVATAIDPMPCTGVGCVEASTDVQDMEQLPVDGEFARSAEPLSCPDAVCGWSHNN